MPVYFLKHKGGYPSDSTEQSGLFVGFSENVGHQLTFKILTDNTSKIIYRSRVHPQDTGANLSLHREDIDQETIVETVDEDDEEEDSRVIDNLDPLDDTPICKVVYSRGKDEGRPILKPLPTINIEDLQGRTFLCELEEDGTRH